jgi:acylphosphatase
MTQNRIECKITGRVQMVMYRDFAQRKARRLGIVGTVQNMKDGSVALVAEGEEEALKKYIALLHKGSVFSKVEEVETKWTETTGDFRDFRIVF